MKIVQHASLVIYNWIGSLNFITVTTLFHSFSSRRPKFSKVPESFSPVLAFEVKIVPKLYLVAGFQYQTVNEEVTKSIPKQCCKMKPCTIKMATFNMSQFVFRIFKLAHARYSFKIKFMNAKLELKHIVYSVNGVR